MKLILTLLSILLTILPSVGEAADDLDSRLKLQLNRSAEPAEVFDALKVNNLSAIEIQDLRFLLAYLPLADIAQMKADDLIENVRLARQAENDLAWGEQIDDDLFKHFVLPHRVSQEPFVARWRYQFLEELKPRVENLTMTQAALEVNHWCHEKATFVQTDGRDQDPLTTIRSGFGRCEEEMILSICALRSVGLPARQCYTPYWAHTDNNHAWVEVWTDGEWRYFGACEPEPVLNQAWFTGAASRAMLVVSTAYGDYHGDEPVLRRYGNSTLINSTTVYGDTRNITVKLISAKGKPVADQRVIFSLWNYGAPTPALALNSNDQGMIELECGVGDWFVSAGNKKGRAIEFITSDQPNVELALYEDEFVGSVNYDYNPPGAIKDGYTDVSSSETEARGLASQKSKREIVPKDSLFKCRLASEDSMRKVSIWPRIDSGLKTLGGETLTLQLDSFAVWGQPLFSELLDEEKSEIFEVLQKAKGNWFVIYEFLNDASETLNFPLRMLVLESLSDKDLRDITPNHINALCMPTVQPNQLLGSLQQILSDLDSLEMERFRDFVIAPRIDREPNTNWREALKSFLIENPRLMTSNDDKAVIKWLRKKIELEDNPDRLGPPLTPDGCLKTRRGTQRDIERLYVGLCRVRGIPARFNPVDGGLERWDESDWTTVLIQKKKNRNKDATAHGELTIKVVDSDSVGGSTRYFKDWSIVKWNVDHLSPVDFGYHTPYVEMEWPRQLPVGRYCLTTGIRRDDGSAPVNFIWFEITPNNEVSLTLNFRVD